MSNRSSNSLKNLRALCLGKNGKCWSILRADLEMKDMLSYRLVEIDKAEAPTGLAASDMSTVKFHNHSHLDRL